MQKLPFYSICSLHDGAAIIKTKNLNKFTQLIAGCLSLSVISRTRPHKWCCHGYKFSHVKAVRDLAGPDIALKIDSNQGWDYPTAVANIQTMAPLNLEYSEQPLAAWDYENIRRLRDKVSLPICADESVFDEKDALKLVNLGAVDYLNIKLGKSAGIHTALKINAIAEAAGCKCMVGCFGESRLALSASAHLAMARPNIHFIDLDSAYSFKQDPVEGGMTYDDKVGGLIHLSDKPGLGASFKQEFLSDGSKIVI